jgi:hypothetical protein
MSAISKTANGTSQQLNNLPLTSPLSLHVDDVVETSEKCRHLGRTTPTAIEPYFHNKLTTRRILVVLAATLTCLTWASRSRCPPFGLDALREALPTTLGANKETSTNPHQAQSTNILDVFQVHQPVFTPSDTFRKASLQNGRAGTAATMAMSSRACEAVLMEHSFGFSYGQPFVGNTSWPLSQ